MTLLAGWAALLGRLSGQRGCSDWDAGGESGRAEIEGLIGFFVNTLALRVDLSGSPRVGELLERVKESALAGQQHQDIPFEQVVEMVKTGEESGAQSGVSSDVCVAERAGGAVGVGGVGGGGGGRGGA